MKLKTEVDITPEETLKLMGAPEYNWLEECINWHKQYNPAFKNWVDLIDNNKDKQE